MQTLQQARFTWPPTCLSLDGVFPFSLGVVSMRLGWKKFARGIATTAVGLSLAAGSWAQTGTTDEGKRKVKTKVAPAYPELAKRMGVTGKVKIEVVITPDGRVKSTRVIGGHPLLVQSCQDAVKEWKFMPAPEETTQIVEFEFAGGGS